MMLLIMKLIKKTPEIIDSILSASLVKALELVTRQHYGCNCYHYKLYNMITGKFLEGNDTYLITPETLDYKRERTSFSVLQ